MAVDRPHSIEYEYRGATILIAFRWEAGSDVPIQAVLSIKSGETDLMELVDKSWASYDEAIEAAKDAARRWIDFKTNP